MSAKSYVYFVQAGDTRLIKIGTSRNVYLRLAAMKTDNPAALIPLLVISGDATVEHGFHKELETHRAHREWFDNHEVVRALISRERAKEDLTHVAFEMPRRNRQKPVTKFQAWRRENKLNAIDVAKLLGLSQASVARIELGKQFPSAKTLICLKTVTGLTANDFLDDWCSRQSPVAA